MNPRSLILSVGSALFRLHGGRRFRFGYHAYKWTYLNPVLRDAAILSRFAETTQLPPDFGSRLDERAVEYPWLLTRVQRFTSPSRFLDAGSTLNSRDIMTHPAIASHRWTIMTLAPERHCFARRGISYVYGDLCDSPFRDSLFDSIFCISVLEHVGMDNFGYTHRVEHRQQRPDVYLQALDEMRRVLKPGGCLFLTVPFGRYENHGWLQQFDGGMLDTVIARFRPAEIRQAFYRHTTAGWRLATQEESSDSSYRSSGKAHAAGAVACLDLQK